MNQDVYFLLLAITCLWVCCTDFLYRKIHNSSLIIILFLQVVFSPLDIHITSFTLVLGMGLILYSLIFIGAGDIKYASVLSLTVAFDDILWAYITTAFAGGFLVALYLFFRILLKKNQSNHQGIPYGIAISIGFYLIILTQNTPGI